MRKIIKYVMVDILRNKIVLAYMVFMLLFSLSVFSLEDHPSKGLLSLLNIILIIVPLLSIIFSTIYIYNSAKFIELLVSQPLQRKSIWISLFSGLTISLSIAFIIGAGIPIMVFQLNATGLIMLVTGIMLTIIFTAIAMLAVVLTRDKAKGIGVAMLLWLYFSLLFDGIVLLLLFQFSEYPLEKPMIILSALNPVDLSRILILLQMDISALMGFTGAIFRSFYGAISGIIFSASVLLLWIIIPLWASLKKFNQKDL